MSKPLDIGQRSAAIAIWINGTRRNRIEQGPGRCKYATGLLLLGHHLLGENSTSACKHLPLR
jgi:hypothetical protein